MTTVHEGQGDLVLGALGSLGTRVDCAGFNRLDLEGPQVLWLVASGAVDLFAVDAGEQGHWHHLGRLEAGSVLLGPVAGPQHTLVARPLRDCVVHRIALRELYQPANTQTWSYDAYGNPQYVPPTTSPLEYALALGVGRGLTVLFQAPMAGERAAAPTDDDVFWTAGPAGQRAVRGGDGEEAAADLLMDPALWQSLVDQQYRLLTTLDRWIEQLERTHETRTAAGIKAGEAVHSAVHGARPPAVDRQGVGVAHHVRRRRRRPARPCALVGARRRYPARRAGPERHRERPARPGGAQRARLARADQVGCGWRHRWWRADVGPLGRAPHPGRGRRWRCCARRGGYAAVHPADRVRRDTGGEGERRGVRAARR
ncbi:NHLP bacteriocin export ABC transporter permease/ATPase subunit OS=Streptomyces tendae OX=1932 GN=GUR47_04660 PE=4 SV=1 [Streptomyces tendae]